MHQSIPLSLYKALSEYRTGLIEGSRKLFPIMFTEEKKIALLRHLNVYEGRYSRALSQIDDVSAYITKNGTADAMPLKAGLNSVMAGIKYDISLIQEFKKELGE